MTLRISFIGGVLILLIFNAAGQEGKVLGFAKIGKGETIEFLTLYENQLQVATLVKLPLLFLHLKMKIYVQLLVVR